MTNGGSFSKARIAAFPQRSHGNHSAKAPKPSMYLLSEAAKPKPKKQVDLFGGDEDSDLFAESKPQQQPPKKKVRHISIITNDSNVSYLDVAYLLCLKWIRQLLETG